MGYNIAAVNSNKAAVNNYLGNDFGYDYDYWVDEMAKSRVLLANLTKLQARVPDSMHFQLLSDPEDDARNLEAAANDYSDAIALISAGKKVNKDQLEKVIQVQSGMAEALDLENDVLDAILSIGLFAAFMDHQFQNIERAAANAVPKIEALKRALEEAKKIAKEAEVQTAIDGGIFVITTFFFPELSVLTKVTIAVGQWAMDDYLGGSKSSSTVDNASNVNSGSSVAQQAVEDWKLVTPKLSKGIKIGGKAIAAAGMYFDINEVRTALEAVNVISNALDDAVKSLYVVQDLLDRSRPAMVRLKLQLTKVGIAIKSTLETINNLHRDTWGIMKQFQWDTNKLVWKIDP